MGGCEVFVFHVGELITAYSPVMGYTDEALGEARQHIGASVLWGSLNRLPAGGLWFVSHQQKSSRIECTCRGVARMFPLAPYRTNATTSGTAS